MTSPSFRFLPDPNAVIPSSDQIFKTQFARDERLLNPRSSSSTGFLRLTRHFCLCFSPFFKIPQLIVPARLFDGILCCQMNLHSRNFDTLLVSRNIPRVIDCLPQTPRLGCAMSQSLCHSYWSRSLRLTIFRPNSSPLRLASSKCPPSTRTCTRTLSVKDLQSLSPTVTRNPS